MPVVGFLSGWKPVATDMTRPPSPLTMLIATYKAAPIQGGTYFPARGGGPHRFRSHCFGDASGQPCAIRRTSPSLRRTARRSYEILASQDARASRIRCSVSAGTRGRPKALRELGAGSSAANGHAFQVAD
jgi:hypothetical protein